MSNANILRYVGNKRAIAKKIINYFPKHKNYISFNFGGGGMFFNKPVAKYNFANDIDKNISNLFQVILTKRHEFSEVLKTIPYHQDIFSWLKKTNFENDIMQAIKFIYIQNFGFFGLDGSLKIEPQTAHKTTIERIEYTYKYLNKCNIQWTCVDFRKILNNISIQNKDNFFIYSDPPYLDSSKRIPYQKDWVINDTIDLLDIAVNCGIRMAISEFNNETVVKLAKDRNLNIISITERNNIRNRKVEILITNYKTTPSLFDGLE